MINQASVIPKTLAIVWALNAGISLAQDADACARKDFCGPMAGPGCTATVIVFNYHGIGYTQSNPIVYTGIRTQKQCAQYAQDIKSNSIRGAEVTVICHGPWFVEEAGRMPTLLYKTVDENTSCQEPR